MHVLMVAIRQMTDMLVSLTTKLSERVMIDMES